MAQIILFGGGDGGGLIIGPSGVRPIPPFEPSLRLQLRGLSALLNGFSLRAETTDREMGKLLNQISNLLVESVEAVVGRLDADNALIYQDDDGGFTCGTTGRPPIPIPWPPLRSPSIADLMANGVLEYDLVEFVDRAVTRGLDLAAILESPASTAEKIGMKISERTIQDLQLLAPSRLSTIGDPIEREVIEFFHKVAEDRRFLSTWATRPAEAANAIGVELSDRAFDRIVAGGSGAIYNPGKAMNAVAIAVAVGIVIMLVTRDEELAKITIRDRSGALKF